MNFHLPNKYAQSCVICKDLVEAGHGHYWKGGLETRKQLSWDVFHVKCEDKYNNRLALRVS
jgi:hypothetical protein